jgi:hemerythrin-like domain-containing protein
MATRIPDAAIRQILFEHDVLRALLSRLNDAAERCAQGKVAVQDLRDSARTLDAALEAQVRHEEEILAPFLEAQGQAARLRQLRDSHRRVIDLLHKLRSREPKRSASGSGKLARYILAALDTEDTELRAGGSRPTAADRAKVH